MGVEERTTERTQERRRVDGIEGATVTAEAAATGTRYPIAPGHRVNVRTGPGTNYRIVRTLPYGQKIPIYCQKPGEWVTGPYGTSRTSGTTSPTASSSRTPTSTRGVTATSHRAATDGDGRQALDPGVRGQRG